MKTSTEEIRQSLKRLSERLNRNLELSQWSPGDGWTRYQVIDADTRKEIFGTWRVLDRQDLVSSLRAAHYILDLVS